MRLHLIKPKIVFSATNGADYKERSVPKIKLKGMTMKKKHENLWVLERTGLSEMQGGKSGAIEKVGAVLNNVNPKNGGLVMCCSRPAGCACKECCPGPPPKVGC